jgi:3-dehydroquinate synthetase
LATLSADDVRSAQAEIIKNALVISPEDIPTLGELLNAEARYSTAHWTEFIRMAIASKSRVLADDPRERGSALVLEYGHTVGHALEMLSAGTLGHGIGVALGMRVAACVANRLGLLSAANMWLHDRLLAAAGLPLTVPAEQARGMTGEALAAQLRMDNKRGYLHSAATDIPMVLLSAPARPVLSDGLPLTPVPLAEVVSLTLDTVL